MDLTQIIIQVFNKHMILYWLKKKRNGAQDSPFLRHLTISFLMHMLSRCPTVPKGVIAHRSNKNLATFDQKVSGATAKEFFNIRVQPDSNKLGKIPEVI